MELDGKKAGRKTRRSGAARSQRPSISMVAAKAGVSIATVSRIVNGVPNRASPETMARVRDVVEELGFRPANVGRALRTNQNRAVALIAANMANPAMAAVAASVENALRETGYVMILCDSHDRADLQDEYLLEMRAHMVRGFILLGAVNSPVLDTFRETGETLLFVNRQDPSSARGSFVGIDNVAAALEVADFFIARSILDPVVIHGPLGSSATHDRVAAFVSSMAGANNGTPPPIFSGEGIDHLEIGRAGGRYALERSGGSVRGLFCLSDLIAYGAARALRESGLAVPGACSIVGFDDNPLNDWVAPWLSSVRVPYDSFGKTIVEALQGIWNGDQSATTILPHRLVLRS
ncbi:MAG: LacI family transcriptional regulator [Alphaproteobacteria bacterium]|nr:LacI family transcriptional regulator [Alphaproteobacteria bacterium]